MSSDFGLTIQHTPLAESWGPVARVTDLDFADNLSLLSNTIQDAKSLHHDLKVAAEQIRLFMNASKTEFMTVNIDPEKASIQTNDGNRLEHFHDNKCLGFCIADSRDRSSSTLEKAWIVPLV